MAVTEGRSAQGGGGVCSGGDVCPGDVYLGCLPRGVSAQGGCLPTGCLPHPSVDRQMTVKILPCPKLRLQVGNIYQVELQHGAYQGEYLTDFPTSMRKGFYSMVTDSEIRFVERVKLS